MLYTFTQARLPLWFWLLVIAAMITLYGWYLSRPDQPQQPKPEPGQERQEKHREESKRLLESVDGLLERIEGL